MSEKLSKNELDVAHDRCTDRRPEPRYDILTQDEINALLSAYLTANARASGPFGAREREVRLYDFSRPDRFSKEHLRSLHSIHSSFGAGLATTLSNLCQSQMAVDLIGVDQISYKEYRASIPSKTVIAEVAVQQFTTSILFEVNPNIVGLWVDCLCGGDARLPSEPSALTPVDLAVARGVLASCLQVYADSWASMVELKPQIQRAVDSESYDDIFLPSETVLVCGFEVHTGQCVGMMTVCIPAAGVEAILPALTTARMTQASRRQDRAAAGDMRNVLEPVILPCRVVLGRANISLSDVMNLDVGDVIRTDRPADAEIELWAGDRHVFDCRPGMRGTKPSVVISGPHDPPATPGA